MESPIDTVYREGSLEMDDRDIAKELQAEELASNKQDREERKRFANKIFYLPAGFLTLTSMTLFFVRPLLYEIIEFCF